MDLPSGVVTFVFSDIEGSTMLWESDPSGMRSSLARHDEIVKTEVEAAHGTVFKHTGDGFGAAFDSVTAGLEAAARVAAAMADEAWDGPALRCRIGVHSGEAEPRDGDYFGSTVTRTARVMDAGNGGQILVSEAARRLLGSGPPTGTSLVDAGEHRLKDLGEPIRIYRLIGSGADDPRELRTLERAPHNLPIQLSTFVGREGQIKEVTDLVRHSRLVTLTGIGGVGKTRLSLQVAAELLAEFDDGAWFVELAPLTEAGLLADTVNNALKIPQDSSLSADELLVKFLSTRRALLVIDNCEHLIDDVATFVDGLLRSCPDVHVLTTSREGLAVMGEVLWRVPSLRVDDDAAAVELFADRARLVQPGFTVNEDNLSAVADLCVRLDGIPLAIELATARLKMLSVEQIAQHLNDRFRLLTGGSRTAVERQRTLRAMMDWSYDLLSDMEQALLRRLAVFYDGFTYVAAEEVCSGDTLARFEVLDLLGRLVEASVVTFDADVRPRYRLLETVRQYSLDKLVDAGEADEARLRHAEFFRSASAEVGAALDHGDFSAMETGSDELGNFRAAMTWAVEAGEGELALELACNLRGYFWNRVMYRESLKWLSSALDMVEDDDSPLVARGMAFALTDAGNIGGGERIVELTARAQKLYDSTTDDASRGALANALAAETMQSDLKRADELFAEAAQLLRSVGDPRWAAPVQNRFITSWVMNSRESEAEILALVDEAAAEGTSIHAAVVRTTFTVLAERYQEVIDFVSRRDPIDDWEEAMMLYFRAHAERATGDPAAAIESIQRFASVPGTFADGWVGWHTGMAYLQLGEIEAAIDGFMAPRAYDAHFPYATDRVNVGWFWAMVASRRGDPETTAILLGFAETLAESVGINPLAFDRQLIDAAAATAREALGEDRYSALFDRGAETRWDDLPLVHR